MNIYCPFAIWCELWTPFLTDRLKDMQRDNSDLRIENSRLRARMIEEGIETGWSIYVTGNKEE